MNYDIVFCGVGGQGILSISAVISKAALAEGLQLKQSEVHGMSQRGGAVVAGLRLSDQEIASPLIPKGRAKLLLSMEPLESQRYLSTLHPEAMIISARNPVLNIPDYPNLNDLLAHVESIPNTFLIDTDKLGREAGSARTGNMVLLGAASEFLPIRQEALEKAITDLFSRKGERMVDINLKAFRAGLAITHQRAVQVRTNTMPAEVGAHH